MALRRIKGIAGVTGIVTGGAKCTQRNYFYAARPRLTPVLSFRRKRFSRRTRAAEQSNDVLRIPTTEATKQKIEHGWREGEGTGRGNEKIKLPPPANFSRPACLVRNFASFQVPTRRSVFSDEYFLTF